MNNFSINFTKFMNTILKISLPLLIIGATLLFFFDFNGFNLSTIVFTLVMSISSLCGYKIINSNLNHSTKIYLLIFIGGFIRILWLLCNSNTPCSDFLTMYDAAGSFIQGNTDIFKGKSYIGRFPHFTFSVLYMSLIRYLFPEHNLIVMKMINLVLGLNVLILIYLLVKELFADKRKALIALLIGCVFPPLITYTAVFCGENLAIPFYLLSIYLFFKSLRNDNHPILLLVLSSISLAVGNLFRMIATVIIIAYAMYILIYLKDKIYKKILNLLFTIIPYILIISCVSSTLQNMNITEYPLWRGSEPKITSVLRGTNLSTFGAWNEEDALTAIEYLDDYNKLESKCKEIIYNRLTSTHPVKLVGFYIIKFVSLWCNGDFSGSYWTQLDMPDNKILFKTFIAGSIPFQLFHIFILILTFLGLLDIETIKKNTRLNLLYLIFGGYILTYLITENQCRYGYIVCWLFIIFSITGINKFKSVFLKNTNYMFSYKRPVA